MSTLLLFEGSVQTELLITRLRKNEAMHNRLSLKSESYSKRTGLENKLGLSCAKLSTA